MGEKLKVSDDVIAICAVNAALKTPGVVEMFGGFQNVISQSILGKDVLTKGVKVVQKGDSAIIDVHIIVEYGTNIPEVAWEIQENVKNKIKEMVDMTTSAINIHVQGVKKRNN